MGKRGRLSLAAIDSHPILLKTRPLAVAEGAFERVSPPLIVGPKASRLPRAIQYYEFEALMILDWRVCSRARLARDARFDGKFFIGVLTTKIYCRPICRSRTSQESNVRYFASAAAAAEAGFRPCLRCRPECAPGTPAGAGTQNTVSRALRLIGETGLEDGGVEALAERVGMGSRHLRRLFLRHLGATPSAVAHTRRLQFAKRLIDETTLPMTRIAFAAGFGSVRRFNAAILKVYRRAPTQLRNRSGKIVRQPEDHYVFHLSFRPPYDWDSLLEFLAAQATPGVEVVQEGYFRRSISLEGDRGYLEASLDASRNALQVRVQFGDPRCLFFIIERVRAMFDLDADWATIARTLATDPALAVQVSSRPGRRVPGCWNGFEFSTEAILGQDLDLETAKMLARKMVTCFGEPYRPADGITHLFPTPEVLAGADLESIGSPKPQADAIRTLGRLVRDGQIRFEKVTDSEVLLAQLQEIPGIGGNALEWIAMRAFREPDTIPSLDPGFKEALGAASASDVQKRSEAWRPWRVYAAMYLWSPDRAVGGREQVATASAVERMEIGSMGRDPVPSDAPSERGLIVRELLKNAHNAYLPLKHEELEEERLERAVVIFRQRNGHPTGRFFIEDNGVGRSSKELLQTVRVSLARDLERLRNGSGFGNLFSWATLSAGSRVVIESSTTKIAGRFCVEINVRRICERMRTATSADDILRDSECVALTREDFDKGAHGTALTIECDGDTDIVNGYKLNCFYDLTDPEDETLLRFLVEGCPIPYSVQDSAGKRIRQIYDRVGYVPATVYLDGTSLERRLPCDPDAVHTQEIRIGGRLAAIAWYLEDPWRTGAFDAGAAAHLFPGPGIRVVKNNVPIGQKNIFSDDAPEKLLNRFAGEVHITSRDVEPNASGQDLRVTAARAPFIEGLRRFYSDLQDKAEARSGGVKLNRSGRRAAKPTRRPSRKLLRT